MGMKIYAAALKEHEILGETWEAVIPEEDRDNSAELHLSDANSKLLFEQIGIDLEEDDTPIPISFAHRAAMLGLNGAAAQYVAPDQVAVGAEGTCVLHYGVVDGYMAYRLGQLLAMIVKARKHGATHIIAA